MFNIDNNTRIQEMIKLTKRSTLIMLNNHFNNEILYNLGFSLHYISIDSSLWAKIPVF